MNITPNPPTLSARALTLALSRPVSGVVGAAIAVKITPTVLKALGVELEPGLAEWTAWAASGGVGFALGYGCMSVMDHIRWALVRRLLAYQGWLYQPKATSTTLWGLALKLLIGPKPHATFKFQDALPSLPIPPLEDTCKRYLDTVQPLLSEEDFANTKRLVDDLLQNDGPILQDYLLERYKKERNWLADWWLADNYLSDRQPIALNVNFFMQSELEPTISGDMLSRCANYCYLIATSNEAIINGSIEPDMILDVVPVCMDGARGLFSACRVPGRQMDTLRTYPDSRHIVFIRKGRYYKLDVYAKDARGRNTRLTRYELWQQLKQLIKMSDADTGEVWPVAALTSQNRTTWAEQREQLLKNNINAATIEAIESSIVVIVFGNKTPKDYSELGKISLGGDGYSRWFDKSCSVEFCADGTTMGGCNCEHSGADATHFVVMWEKCIQQERYGPDGFLVPDPKPVHSHLTPISRLHWDLDAWKGTILNAYDAHMKLIEDIDVLCLKSDVSKSSMKKAGFSPDGYIQMAIQLAYWRMHKRHVKTYEPASTRLFALGRTENVNPVSVHSTKWVRMMDDPTVCKEEKVRGMRSSVDYQSRSRLDCTSGKGCDRHLLGLLLAAREMGRDIPQLFTDKGWLLPTILSTSQVPTQLYLKFTAPVIKESIAGGFGPLSEESYGILYVCLGETVIFNITNWKSGGTDCRQFGKGLSQAMEDMRQLFASAKL